MLRYFTALTLLSGFTTVAEGQKLGGAHLRHNAMLLSPISGISQLFSWGERGGVQAESDKHLKIGFSGGTYQKNTFVFRPRLESTSLSRI